MQAINNKIGLFKEHKKRNMKRPNIKILQDFAKSYFLYKCPVVRWKKMESIGRAVLKKKVMYLNPLIELRDDGCKVGTLSYRPRAKEKIKLKEGEQFFLTLLHEIGHFKVKKKLPKEWIKIKQKLTREAKEHLRIEKTRDISWGKKPKTKKEEQKYIYWYLDYNAGVTRKKGESDSYHFGRCEDFKSWLIGDMASEHILVEEWARKEFKKRRKEIRNLLLKK